jgi:hypothetical protein
MEDSSYISTFSCDTCSTCISWLAFSTSITIHVSTSQHIALLHTLSLCYTFFPDLCRFLFQIASTCREILTFRIKPIKYYCPWLSVDSNISHGIFIFDLYIVASFHPCHQSTS